MVHIYLHRGLVICELHSTFNMRGTNMAQTKVFQAKFRFLEDTRFVVRQIVVFNVD